MSYLNAKARLRLIRCETRTTSLLIGGGSHRWLALSGRDGSPRGTSYAAIEFLGAVGLGFLAYDCTAYPSSCPSALRMPAPNRTQGPPQFTYRSV